MKVFISHSSRDKWAARRISDEIIRIGGETFLDEKDIKTGDSIDEKIQENLAHCDDLLILVSPASIDSQWVLIELGGALALKKNIIPIFLYVGANDIPKPISKLLGRDINEIDKYYAEIKSKLEGKTKPKEKVKETIREYDKYTVGDNVKLPSRPYSDNSYPGWDPEMNDFLGLEARIQSIETHEIFGTTTVKIDIDDMKWYWDINWLIKLR